ncbi:SIS domain-containing protein [Neobacillus sp. DY30]|uniref:SIS domain-containing protein n=1 Tax=Neobacillus sp. DY30 TaxID=3047871 RepID=UPI0024BFB1B0|nr:SIS domain-containing protein [Neobacillus sp. DY30]WHX98104.1 SIS domain-containing protein [Neobacillus sp. DY30]
MNFNIFYDRYKEEFIETIEKLDVDFLETLLYKMNEVRIQGKQIFVLGNGGSATSASHWVCDFLKGVNFNSSKRFKIYSLTDNNAVFSALGNDFSYDDVFVEQLKNYLEKGDLVIGMSVSGKSPNLVKALQYAREQEATTISLIGDFCGEMGDHSDYTLVIPSKNYGIVEDCHMYIAHTISQHIYQLNADLVK